MDSRADASTHTDEGLREHIKDNIANADQTITTALRDGTSASVQATEHAASTAVDMAVAAVESVRETAGGLMGSVTDAAKVRQEP
jgi:hypothetical protein